MKCSYCGMLSNLRLGGACSFCAVDLSPMGNLPIEDYDYDMYDDGGYVECQPTIADKVSNLLSTLKICQTFDEEIDISNLLYQYNSQD